MSRFTPILFAILAGAVAYGAISAFQHASPLTGSISDAGVTASVVPRQQVPTSAKTGAKSVAPRLAPTLAPVLAPTSLLAPTLAPRVSPSPSGTVTPIPYTKIATPTPTSASVPTSSPTPSPTSTPSPTAQPTSTPTATPAPTTARVIINEIAWGGTSASSTDEWIELYNPGSSAVDLTGWKVLIAGDNAISLSNTIGAGGYYLMERTDNTVVGDVAADYAGPFGHYGLNNAGEHLTLVDASGTSIDDVDCSAQWFAGTATASMERISADDLGNDAANWAANDGSVTIGHDAAGVPIWGTPRGKNSVSRW